MTLAVGIVGLPNVGKSTLFNALLKKQQAYVANFPFATIEPNIGVVPVPDYRLERLAQIVETDLHGLKPPIVPATVEFMDIAGLIKGASQGEGLGNKFLSHIREANAVCHVVRLFTDPEIVKQGVTDPKTDFEVVETELKLADFQTLEKQKDPGNTPNLELKKWWTTVTKLKDALQKGIPAREVVLADEDEVYAKQLSLLTAKPILVALNVDEESLKDAENIEQKYAEEFGLESDQVITISAKVESELSDLSVDEQRQYLEALGVYRSGLERLIQKAFKTLGLITFLTAGVKEVRAWTIRRGSTALRASSEIHTDFAKNFIKADVVDFEDFVKCGGWKGSRDLGKVRSEGKDYIMQDGDVVEFKIGS